MNFQPAHLGRAVAACVLLTLSACGGGGGNSSATSADATTLVAVSTLAAGAQCTNGGRQVDFGADRDGNGTLDASEIGDTFYACDGGAGASGLIALSAEPAGANCTYGGNRVASGLDANGSGQLEAGEISNSGFVCNGAAGATGSTGPTGADGFTSLAVMANEAAGANCATGGTRITAGLDTDRDGTLAAAEVTMTRYVCNGAQGPTGATGAAGLNSLALVTSEPAGATCAAGGSRISSGLDANRNGVLDAAEATGTVYACNGIQGPAGADGRSAVMSSTTEPAGANCTYGGSKLLGGLDADGNGTLDAGEVATTSYACNGATGATGPIGLSSILNSAPEPAGANCAFGGRRLTSGLDANRNGVLDAAEVSSTSYVCNGTTGPAGPAGPQGPQGPSGVLGVYGDGSAGSLNVGVGGLDLTAANALSLLPAGGNMQFTNIAVAGVLKVPSGTFLRASGDINVTGSILVWPGAQDSGPGAPNSGIALAPASSQFGGIGLSALAASQLTRPSAVGGGAGERGINGSGGEGGGSLLIAAGGNVALSPGGVIDASGRNGANGNVGTADAGGPGGGGGGLIVIGARGSITVSGTVRANGGNGGDGFDGAAGGAGAGGGGGGGGGIIHLIASSTPSVTGSLQASGGARGFDAGNTAQLYAVGGGGGASGGNGGNGSATAFGQPTVFGTAGASGYVFTTVAPQPEYLLR